MLSLQLDGYWDVLWQTNLIQNRAQHHSYLADANDVNIYIYHE
jgi:hypothetical protein